MSNIKTKWLLDVESYSPMAGDSIDFTEKFDSKDEAMEFFRVELRGAPTIGVWLKRFDYDDEGGGDIVDTVCLQSIQCLYGNYNDDEPDERMGFEKDLDAFDTAVSNYH